MSNTTKNYRVNYGNGQISHTFASARAAFAFIAECERSGLDPYTGFYFVQYQFEPGEWCRVKERKVINAS